MDYKENITIDGLEFTGYRIATEHAALLMIKAPHGFLGCGYFDLKTADKLKEHVAIVSGVKTFSDMLEAQLVDISRAAAELGITPQMTGREALLLLHRKK